MSKKVYLKDFVIIRCIVERGEAQKLFEAAQNVGALAATIYFARGTGIREKMGMLGIVVEPEKEVIEVAAPKDVADHIFDVMVDTGKLNLPGKGFIYMTDVIKALTYIPEED
ncbi:MAG: P-II family nitrogen regulator [Campylobacterota bacterium]|nr:P-II family nitrogen regulator [Campylobacterota bacterium]